MTATLEELRELSLRSRRSQRWGALAVIVALLLFPVQVLVAGLVPSPWVAPVALVLGALPALRFAFLAGEERGAFRRVFRRLADERRTRTLVPSEPAPAAEASARAR